jgi:hypothetical protein
MLLRIDKKNPQIILLVGVALFIPLLGAYMMFDSLREADFLSSGIKYEESDIGDLLADKQGMSQVGPLLSECPAGLESCRQRPAGYHLQPYHLLLEPFPIRC